jgi:hypothetical protein
MKSISTRSWASELVESFQNAGCESSRHSVLGLTADEMDLLEPPPLASHKPWVVPLAVRSNSAAEETAEETADD